MRVSIGIIDRSVKGDVVAASTTAIVRAPKPKFAWVQSARP